MKVTTVGLDLAKMRIPAKVTDESDDVDRVVSCGAWRSDFSAVGHHRCQFSVLESGCTTAGQPGRPTRGWTEVAGHWGNSGLKRVHWILPRAGAA